MSQGCSTYINEYGHHITVFNSKLSHFTDHDFIDQMAFLRLTGLLPSIGYGFIEERAKDDYVWHQYQTIDKAQAGLDRMAAEHGWQLVQAGGRS